MADYDIVRADVIGFAPELSTLTDQAFADVLNYVNTLEASEIGLDSGPELRLARILLAAHFGATTKRAGTGAAGPVVSEAAGGLRRSYGLVALSQGNAGFGSTMYGMQFLTLVQMSGGHGPVVI